MAGAEPESGKDIARLAARLALLGAVALNRTGLAPLEAQALFLIHAAGRRSRREIAKALGRSAASVHGGIKALVRSGLAAETEYQPPDGHALRVYEITPRGERHARDALHGRVDLESADAVAAFLRRQRVVDFAALDRSARPDPDPEQRRLAERLREAPGREGRTTSSADPGSPDRRVPPTGARG